MLVRSPFLGSIHLQGSDLDWKYRTEPQENLHGRRCNWPRGRVLGGCSAINQMIWVRGDPRSFDDWENRLGCTGWGYKDVLPYFKTLECFHGPDPHGLRGHTGPVHVSRAQDCGLATAETCQLFMQSCSHCGIPINDDYNGHTQEGVSMIQANVKDGVRSDTATAYLHPNITVLTNTVAQRVVVEGNRATGVELLQGGVSFIRRCKFEVVLCCGSIATPQLLMLSGIGPKSHLEELGLPCLKDLPVGQNLQDHVLFPLTFRTSALAFNPSRPVTGGMIPSTGLSCECVSGLKLLPMRSHRLRLLAVPSRARDLQLPAGRRGCLHPLRAGGKSGAGGQ